MASKSSAWKNLEKYSAEVFHGVRIHRGGDFSESLPDVIAPLDQIFPKAKPEQGLIVECKYRANQPWIDLYKKKLKTKKSFTYLILKTDIVNPITDLKDFLYLMPIEFLSEFKPDSNRIIYLDRSPPGYLLDYCSQPKNYIINPDIVDSLQLLYYKATKDRVRVPFKNFCSIAVIGQKNDRVRLACFFQSEMRFVSECIN